MSDELDYRWRSVKDYGQPTVETCPFGYRWRNGKATGMASEVWSPLPNVVEWQPLPPPCDKVMPSPEPDVDEKIADYVRAHRDYAWMTPWQAAVEAVRVVIGDEAALRDVIAAARPDWMGVLDAVEAGETVGRVRPWQEAPNDDTAVLGWCDKGWAWSLGRTVRYHRSPWMAQPAPPAVDPSDHRKQEAEG